jgi:hypothetical protein
MHGIQDQPQLHDPLVPPGKVLSVPPPSAADHPHLPLVCNGPNMVLLGPVAGGGEGGADERSRRGSFDEEGCVGMLGMWPLVQAGLPLTSASGSGAPFAHELDAGS